MLKRCWELVSSDCDWAILLRSRVCTKRSFINYNLSSSIWSGLKVHISTVMENIIWQLGNGIKINFWCDPWLSKPIVEQLQIPHSLHKFLSASIQEFIREGQWLIPEDLVQRLPTLAAEISNVIILKTMTDDQLIWKPSDSRDLTAKDAYKFLNPCGIPCNWGKLIWSKSIPPSKSFLLWRLLHNKIPTDDQLWARGCHIVSMCCLCGRSYETTHHVFFSCDYASRFCLWLSNCLEIQIDHSSIHYVLAVFHRNWYSQVKDVILSAVCYTLGGIWHSRNKLRFDSKVISVEAICNWIAANISFVGSFSIGYMSSDVSQLLILRKFSIPIRFQKAPNIKEVLWLPPTSSWIKVNTDGAAKGAPGMAGRGGIFRGENVAILGCFTFNVGVSFALHAEFVGAILAIELAHRKGWHRLWLECDSKLVIDAFNSLSMLPWQLRNR